MKRLLLTIKEKVYHVYLKGVEVIIPIAKKIFGIIWKMIIFFSSLLLFVIPFLNKIMSTNLAQYVWYPIFVFWILYSFIKKNIKEEKTLLTVFRKGGIFGVLFVVLSIFVFRYYEIDYIWKWVIFIVMAVYFPVLFYLLFKEEIVKNKDKEQHEILQKNLLKNILLFWCYDLTYLAIFNHQFWATIILGTLAVAFVFYDLTNLFLSNERTLHFFVALKLVVTLCASAYLIYIIPDSDFQNIILTIIAAVYGGVFTLVGVAWSFRKGDLDRKNDLRRIDMERKEEERKKHMPYIKVVFGKEADCEAHACIHKGIDLSKGKDKKLLENNFFYQITIKDFFVKNISEYSIILKGVNFIDRFYLFKESIILEKGEICKIRTTDNWSIVLSKEEKYLEIIASDILGNDYVFKGKLVYVSEKNSMVMTAIGQEEYTGFMFDCIISNISLPKAIMCEH